MTAVAYAALTVGLIEIAGAVSEALLFPDWTGRLVTFLLLLGFPIVLVVAWIFDFEQGSLKRTESLPSAEPAPRERRASSRSGFVAAPPVPEPTATARRAVRQPLSEGVPEPPDPDRLKRAALAHVRHELRTPINAILGYSEMLLEDEADPEIRLDLGRINESGRRLLALVDGILDPARLEGSIDRDIESFAAQIEADLRTPVNAVIGYSEMLLEGQRESGRSVLVPDLERILGAARTLLDTSSEIVQVATRAAGPEEGGEAGPLQASSELARGVLSKLRMSAGAAESAIEGRGTLLVVDDNATNRDLLARQLARHGYVVAAAADGREALERLQTRSYDLVLLDVIMPGMDGVETLHRLKQDPALEDIPVVMLSSLDEVDSAIRCIEAGAEEYITKPVQPTLLEARIAANLELRRMRERERALRARIEADGNTIDRLLLSAFPSNVADRIRQGETGILDVLPETIVLFCLASGSRHGAGRQLAEHVALLSDWFQRFEAIAEDAGVEVRLAERLGFVAAMPRGNGEAHGSTGREIAEVAVRIRDVLAAAGEPTASLFRMGIHSGPAVAAVIGTDRLRFDLWGEAIETARHIAAASEPGEVLVSPSAQAGLRDEFRMEPARMIEIEGVGQLRPYALLDRAGD